MAKITKEDSEVSVLFLTNIKKNINEIIKSAKLIEKNSAALGTGSPKNEAAAVINTCNEILADVNQQIEKLNQEK